MNIDMCMPLTPSNCRKLLLMRKVFKMSLSDEIVQIANLDLITQDQLDDRLPVQLVSPYFQGDTLLKFIQHAVDYDGRFVNVGSDLMKNLLASTLYSIFVDKKIVVRENPSKSKTLRSLLDLVKVSHQTITKETDDFDPDVMVTFSSVKDVSDEFVTQTRDRILHINHRCNDFSGRTTSQYGHLFGFSSSKSYDELVNEYYHSISSFDLHDNLSVVSHENTSAVKLTTLGAALSPMFPEVSFDKLLLPKKPVMETNQGVKILNPYHITRAFGAYYGLYNSQEEQPNDSTW